jgi:glycosyltransferase involved in cell wall biosynthesis
VGNLIPRKGVLEFLQACSILQRQGYQEYSLWVVGDGLQRQELEAFAKQHDLQNKIRWVGAVEYELVGEYFRQADVFVFPTLEDVWGLVAVEAMMFGKPILCSKWAGAAELVADGENGYVFDPHEPQKLAELMKLFTGNPELIDKMGQKSKQIMADHAPEMVARSLAEVVSFTLDDRRSLRSP